VPSIVIRIKTKASSEIKFRVQSIAEPYRSLAKNGSLFMKGCSGDSSSTREWFARLCDEIEWNKRKDAFPFEFAMSVVKRRVQSQPTSSALSPAFLSLFSPSTASLLAASNLESLTSNFQNQNSILQEEYTRMGVLKSPRWRITSANNNYELCPSYPSVLCVPSTISDEVLSLEAKERSKGRVPALTWLHPRNGAPLCRSSQPLSGLMGKILNSDNKALTAIRNSLPTSTFVPFSSSSIPTQSASGGTSVSCSSSSTSTSSLIIVDARPFLNARANALVGKGFENVVNLEDTRVFFMNIDNIHEMRLSMEQMTKAIKGDQIKFLSSLESSKWLAHLEKVLRASLFVAKSLENGDPVLVHCSDGWDRTSQLSSLPQLLLDPYYRSFAGFSKLIEKDWLSFGHMFDLRTGSDTRSDSEKSPIFIQFIDCVYQLTKQFPQTFEFNELYLMSIVQGCYSRYFSNFLGNCERERREKERSIATLMFENECPDGCTSGINMWTFLRTSQLSDKFANPHYIETQTLLQPCLDIRAMSFWSELYAKHHLHLFVKI